jgi:hypothetical protein
MQRIGICSSAILTVGNGLNFGGTVMQRNLALKETPLALGNGELVTPISAPQTQVMAIDRAILDRAAEALFEFVFSSCDRLDGKHHWNDCDENTKDGFRGRPLP